MYVCACACARERWGEKEKGDKRRNRVRDRVEWILEGEGGGGAWWVAWRCGR